MKVFISWSGERSRAVAETLRDWIPNVIQAVEPWVSSEDIEKGTFWGNELTLSLEQARFGILCLTPENLKAPWIMFEAGALTKAFTKARVSPFLLGLRPSSVEAPLSLFQATEGEKKEDVYKLIRSLNETLKEASQEQALAEERLSKGFKKWWPDLEEKLQKIPPAQAPAQSRREVPEMTEEILEIVRELARNLSLLATPDYVERQVLTHNPARLAPTGVYKPVSGNLAFIMNERLLPSLLHKERLRFDTLSRQAKNDPEAYAVWQVIGEKCAEGDITAAKHLLATWWRETGVKPNESTASSAESSQDE